MKTYRISAICHKSVEVEAKNLKDATKLGRETIGQPENWSDVLILGIEPMEHQVLKTVATESNVTVKTVADALSEPVVAVPVQASEPVAVEPVSSDAKVQVLTCGKCEKTWERPAQRGRKPINCPECN